MSYSTLKMTFSGDLIRKIVKFSFLDSGHFGGHFEFAQPTRSRSEIFGLVTRIVFNMLKPCSVQIWDLYQSEEHPRDLPTALTNPACNKTPY